MDFAIVGMAAMLPGSPDAEHWIGATDPAFRPVPKGRWPDRDLVADTNGVPDRTVTLEGGWVDAPGGAKAWTRSVVGAVLDEADARPERTELVLANLSLPSPEAVAQVRAGEPIDHSSGPALDAREHFRLARATALDAACASGLYAVRLAADALALGRCRVAIAAGVQACDPAYLLVGFSQLLALSPNGVPKPLDANADGLIVGEGAAAIALMRLDDALRDGRHIHAVLRGGGLGNDGRKGNLLAPDSNGQLRAMQAAWSAAGLDPRTAGYVECHATGTKLGDKTELDSLEALLEGAEHPVAVGSAKALIGHSITVAGLAGLIRAVGAVRDGFVPAGPAEPAPTLAHSSVLRSASGREPWPAGRPRRAAVSAFGFGGTNAHLIIDAPPPPIRMPEPEHRGRFGFRAGIRRLIDGDLPPPTTPHVPRQALVKTPRLSVVAVAAQLGELRNNDLFEALRRKQGVQGELPQLAVDPRRWRMPPLELAQLLPQQVLALELAGDALESEGIEGPGVAVVFGMELDPTPCTQVIRLMDDASEPPALNAQRVQGQLPNFVANRISAQLDLEGPSYTVSAGSASGVVAIEHAARLLSDPSIHTVLVGAFTAAGPDQGGIVLALQRAHEGALAELDFVGPAAPTEVGDSVLAGLRPVLEALCTGERTRLTLELPACTSALRLTPRHSVHHQLPERDCTLKIGDGPSAPAPSAPATPARAPGLFGPGLPSVVVAGPAEPSSVPLTWRPEPQRRAPETSTTRTAPASSAPARPAARPAPAPTARPAAPVARPSAAVAPSPMPLPVAPPAPRVPPHLLQEIHALQDLTNAMVRSQGALVEAHAQFLDTRQQAADQLTRLGVALGTALDHPTPVLPELPRPVLPASAPAPRIQPRPTEAIAPTPVARPVSDEVPRTFDRRGLEIHAAGKLSEVFGPKFAHLDQYEPRTRMPMAPLLLCSRVLDIEGTPLELGPARIVTEYDLPTDASWSHHDGKPNACVIVESGQADLFLVSWLGIEADAVGERVYRLLDCDLIFHGPRPEVGETLHHDIRIKRFAKLGSKILFYFEYDCTSNTDGRKVLSMRNGCAGFFTPGELATPHGLDPAPHALEQMPAPVRPLATTTVTALDAAGVQHLVHGRFSQAFGPSFAAADGSRLTLPDSEWRLVHAIEEVRTSGGPYGLGMARTLQHLRDDDWFNPCHFKGDPCMPGTLMLEGCLQAVQTWLLATGIAANHPDGLFEPLPDLPFELRCRGQVVPGHTRLTYEARIKEADLGDRPYAIADVLLVVDGTPVVEARNVGVTVGRRSDARTEPVPAGPKATERPEPVVDTRRIYEYSIGDAERAFGPRYREYAGISPRCARMPGPPLLQMSEVIEAEQPFEVRQGSEVTIDYRVPPEAWYFETTPGTSMPFAILLETALQPCGWLTAWEAAGIKDGRDLFFRNLGGTATQHVEVWPDAGTLTTRTKQTTVAESAGLLIHRFELSVTNGDQPVYDCTTSFGYFTAAALDGQKGLPLRDEDRRAAETAGAPVVDRSLVGHPSMPRDDWRNLDRLVRANPTGGREGKGWYVAEKTIDPTEWFFTAHFFLDPVMPGSLGLEAALQLAKVIFEERTGPKARCTPIRIGVPHSWKYRGQMRRPVKAMTIELEITHIDDDSIVFDAVLRADGLPIYELNDFGLSAAQPRPEPAPAALPARGPHAAALLDRFDIHGDAGTGVLRLDPARFPWLADHCPTLTAPALPMAFAAEIAAEAAQLLAPNLKVVGVPRVEANSWIHTGDGPVDLLVAAVRSGDQVAVSLALHVENKRFPKLSGPKVHMKAIVQLGADYAPVGAVPAAIESPRVQQSIEDYYGGGLTFHGPSLQGMIDVGARSKAGATALFHTKPDAELNGQGAPFVLDPLLLDTATHPMVSGEPQLWVDGLGPGYLAYPVMAEDLKLYGPRPSGRVECRMHTVHADAQTLCFDVWLIGENGPWCSFRWTEALVPGGPVLGQTTPVRKAFIWDRQARPEVQIGRQVGQRWRVEANDLVEPIEGTLVGLCCVDRELEGYREAGDRRAWALSRLAAKGAARAQLASRLRDVHPRDIELLDLRPDRYICVNSPSLTAQELIDNLGPTRFHLNVETGPDWAEAWIEETGWPT